MFDINVICLTVKFRQILHTKMSLNFMIPAQIFVFSTNFSQYLLKIPNFIGIMKKCIKSLIQSGYVTWWITKNNLHFSVIPV